MASLFFVRYTLLIRINAIWILRLRFGRFCWKIIVLEFFCQFPMKVEGREFEKLKIEVKNNRVWEKISHSYKISMYTQQELNSHNLKKPLCLLEAFGLIPSSWQAFLCIKAIRYIRDHDLSDMISCLYSYVCIPCGVNRVRCLRVREK